MLDSDGFRMRQGKSSTMTPPRRVQFILKVSKLCNLRCRYCYEYPELGNRKRMSFDELGRVYAHVSEWLAACSEPTEVEFVWHGGEPLLVPPDFFRETLATQRRTFGDRSRTVRNVVQTNLTVLDDDRIRLLRESFDAVGISLDLYGGLRVDAGGTDSIERVLANLDVLRAAEVKFGCITVITRANLSFVRDIIGFYDELGVASVRLLPLIDGAYSEQHAGYEITREQVLEALKAAFEALVERDSALLVEPLKRYVDQIVHAHTPGAPRFVHDKRKFEPVFFVDTDGNVYGYGDLYVPDLCYGNVFTSPFEELLGSAGHERAAVLAEQRMAATCRSCRYFGSCDGYPLAEGAGRRTRDGRADECIVELGMLSYLDRRLSELGLFDAGGSPKLFDAAAPSG
jgi:uncharacterized protein